MKWAWMLMATASLARAAVETPPLIDVQVSALIAAAVDRTKEGNYHKAETILNEARALAAPPAVTTPGLYVRVLTDLAEVIEVLGDWNRAQALLREAVISSERAFGPDDPRTAAAEALLASVETALGDFATAEARLTRVVAIQRAAPAAYQPDLAVSLTALAAVQLDRNRSAEAEKMAAEAIAIADSRRMRTPEYASMLCMLAMVYVAEHRNARALPLINQALAVIESTLSAENPRSVPILVERGILQTYDGKYTLAEMDMRRALAILDRTDAPEAANVDSVRLVLGGVLIREGKLDDADALLTPAIARQRAFFGGPNIRLAYEVVELARLREMQKRFDEAAALYREAIAMSNTAAKIAVADDHPAREKDVRRLAHQASDVFKVSLR